MTDSAGAIRAGGGDRLYRQLFTEMIAGVAVHEIIVDESGKPVDYRFLEVNPEFEKLTGLRASDIVGRRAREVIPDVEPEWIERYGRVALSGIPEQFESYSAALGRHFLVRAFRPAPGQFAALFFDVTERTRAEADLRERNAFTETIIASAGEGLIVYDRDLRFVVWNPVMEQMTGLSAGQVLGGTAHELFPEVMAAGVGDDIARALTGEQSGGSVAAESEPGRGSAFTVFLPLVATDFGPGPELRQIPNPDTTRAGTVLVVEDDDAVRGFATRVLEQAGYRVLAAAGGIAALEIAREATVDLLLTDVVMPTTSGREVADRLTSIAPGVRVLFVSGHDENTIVRQGVLDPSIRYLAKPFTADGLIGAVDDVLATPPE